MDEKSLSLRNLPVNTNEFHKNKAFHEPFDESSDDQFEFSSDFSSELSHAEDIFFRGKLVPLRDQAFSNDHINKISCKDEESKGFRRRSRFESLPDSKMIARSNSSKNTRLMRTSRSMDQKKASRDSSLRFETPNVVRALSDKSSERKAINNTTMNLVENSPQMSDASGVKVAKPRWSILMFGHVKFPQEMDLQDIKNRQVRLKPCQLASMNQNDRKGSWGLLKMLSCKNHASVAVTTSTIGYMPEV